MHTRTGKASVGAFLLLSLASAFAAPRGATTAPEAPGPAVPGPGKLTMPDLVIVQMTKGPGARAQIRNQGTGNAAGCTLFTSCYLGSTSGGVSAKSGANWDVPALKAGSAVWVSLGKCTPVDGLIDSGKAVKESSESNNTYVVKQ